MFIFLIWPDDIIFSTVNMNPKKTIQTKKRIQHKALLVASIIDSDFEEV